MHNQNKPRIASEILEQNILTYIQEVFLEIPKKMRSNERILAELGQRSINQILKDGETCYMNPCLDYTLGLINKLRQKLANDTNINMGIERGEYILNGVSIPIAHFFIKLIENEDVIIDFSADNTVNMYRGAYTNAKGLKTIHIDYIPGDKIDIQENIFEITQKLGIELERERFQSQVKKLQQDNTDAQFQRFLDKTQNKIILVNNGKIEIISIGSPREKINNSVKEQIDKNFVNSIIGKQS